MRKEWSIISNVYELYKRIMKHDIKAVDQIQSLEDAKYIIKMMLKTNVDIYNGQGIMSQMFMKKRQIIALRECSFCMIEEFDGKWNVLKIDMETELWKTVKAIILKKLNCRILV